MVDLTQSGVAIVAAAGGALSIAATVAQEMAGASQIDALLLQGGVVGIALGVGLWMLRRSDARDDRRDANHAAELKVERAAHEQTRAELLEALRELTYHRNQEDQQ